MADDYFLSDNVPIVSVLLYHYSNGHACENGGHPLNLACESRHSNVYKFQPLA